MLLQIPASVRKHKELWDWTKECSICGYTMMGSAGEIYPGLAINVMLRKLSYVIKNQLLSALKW